MPQETNLNVSPYFDDFDANKDYYKVLFKPGYPIQARELTNLQSILQNQIEQYGRHVFKEGSVVIPGQLRYENPLYAIEIEPTFNGAPISLYFDQLLGKKLRGSVSGVSAEVVLLVTNTESERGNYTLYLKYLESGGADFTNRIFQNSETLLLETPLTYGNFTVPVGQGICNTISENSASEGSGVSVASGVYFVRGVFARVSEQTIILDQYSTTPSYKVGFDVIEDIVNYDEDPSLVDNAQGFSNYSAPGADRLKITLELSKRSIDDAETNNFVEILRVINGAPQFFDKNPQYNLIRDELARRTFDESGDYFVSPFTLFVRDSLNDRTLTKGIYFRDQQTVQGNIPSEDLMVYQIGPGKAYVNGYDVETISPRLLDVPKARSTERISQVVQYNAGSLVVVNNGYGSPSIGLGTQATVSLMDSRIGTSPHVAAGTTIGVARVYDFVPESDYVDDTSRLNLRLFDIQTFTIIGLTTSFSTNLQVPSFVEGKKSRATGYLKSVVSAGTTTLTLYETTGNFLENEQIIINGIDNGRLITSVKDYSVSDIKSVYSQVGITTFNADLVLSRRSYIARPGTTFNINNGVVSAGLENIFTNIVKVGDIVSYTNTTFTGDPIYNKVTAIGAGGTNFTISGITTVTGVCDGVLPSGSFEVTNVIKVSPSINSRNSSLLTKLSKNNVSIINFEGNEISQRRSYDISSFSGSTISITIDPSDIDVYFDSFDEDRFVITYSDGSIEPMRFDKYNLSDDGKTLTFNGLTKSSGTNVKVITSVYNIALNSKTKKLNKVSSILVSNSKLTSSGIGTTTLNDGLTYSSVYGTRVQDREISLNVPDAVRVIGVYESNGISDPVLPNLQTSGNPAGNQNYIIGEQIEGKTSGAVAIITSKIGFDTLEYTYLNTIQFSVGEIVLGQESNEESIISNKTNGDKNISKNFSFDDGQRDSFYDFSRIVRNQNIEEPKRKLKVIFQNYTIDSSDTGEVITANSYSDSDFKYNVLYYQGARLTDFIDIRPRVAPYTGSSKSPFEFDSRNFASDGQYSKYILAPGENLFIDYSYFVGRIDRVFLNSDGTFDVVQGTPSSTPIPPPLKGNSLDIATIYIPPYVYDVKNVSSEMSVHKRYRMSDISLLENRIQRVEKFTTLSMLESKTENFTIKDAETGLDRFKCGFFVDNFSNHEYHDLQDPAFKSCIDTSTNTLRPLHYTTSLDLQLGSEAISGVGQTFNPNIDQSYVTDLGSPNIRKTGDLLTLDYNEVLYFEQIYATKTESVTPFLVRYWTGFITLNPPTDSWIDERAVTTTSVNEIVDRVTRADQNFTSVNTSSINNDVFVNGPPNPQTGTNSFDWIANAQDLLSGVSTLGGIGVNVNSTETSTTIAGFNPNPAPGRGVGGGGRISAPRAAAPSPPLPAPPARPAPRGQSPSPLSAAGTGVVGGNVGNTVGSPSAPNRGTFGINTLLNRRFAQAAGLGGRNQTNLGAAATTSAGTSGGIGENANVVGTDVIQLNVLKDRVTEADLELIRQLLPPDVAADFITAINTNNGQRRAIINFIPGQSPTITFDNSTETSTSTQSSSNTSSIFVPEQIITADTVSQSISNYTEQVRYLRSRNIEFDVKGLRPRTRFYSFFQGIDVSKYIIPKLLEIEMISGKFEIGETVESDPNFATDKIRFRLCKPNHLTGPFDGSNPPSITNPVPLVDIATGQVLPRNPATLPRPDILRLNPYNAQPVPENYTESSTFLNVDTRALQLPSEIEFYGKVSTNMRLIGKTSGAVARVTNVRLLSDNGGRLIGSLFIPDPNVPGNPQWVNGSNTFTVIDTPNLSDLGRTYQEFISNTRVNESSAQEDFVSSAVANVTQTNILTTRNITILSSYNINTTTVTNTVVNTTTSTTAATPTGGTNQAIIWENHDPLAQSFYVRDNTGVFLTSVEVFFETKDEFIPVTLQIRPIMAGVPSNMVVPFSEVTLNPDQINLSVDATVPTKFTFSSPVYLPGPQQLEVRNAPIGSQQTSEFAIVLLSGSPQYRVFISELGFNDIQTGTKISVQPTLGSLFKSQNGSTWSPAQLEDLKYRIYRADFVPEGLVRFFNPKLSLGNKKVTITGGNQLLPLAKKITVGLGSTGYSTAGITTGLTIKQGTATGKLVGLAGSVTTISIANTGIGYTDGTFTGVSLKNQTGIGFGAEATIGVVNSGIATVTITNGGFGYVQGDSLFIPEKEFGLNVGFGGKITVTGTSNISNAFVIDNVQGNFSAGIASLTYLNSSGSVVSTGATISTIINDPYYDGLHMKINQINHGMHSTENYVKISEMRPLQNEVNSRSTQEITSSELSIPIISSAGFETFEGVAVSASNPGYAIIGYEVIEYTSVSGNTLIATERGVDGTQPQPYVSNVAVYKYEFNGISLRRINKVHNFAEVDENHGIKLNSYHIKIDPSDTDYNNVGIGSERTNDLYFRETVQTGEPGTLLSSNIQFEAITPNVANIVPGKTNLSARVRTFSATSISGSEKSFLDNGFQQISLNSTSYFGSPRLVCSEVNEQEFITESPGGKSFTMEFLMNTTDSRVSPVIDLINVSAIFTSNLVNSPVGVNDNSNYANDDTVRSLSEDSHEVVYISKPISLKIPANSIKVILSASHTDSNDVRVLYRLFRADAPGISQNYELFPGYRNYQVDGQGIKRVIDKSQNDGSADSKVQFTSDRSFLDYEYSVDDLPDFDAFSIKVVMAGQDQSCPPLIRQLRAIATVKPKV